MEIMSLFTAAGAAVVAYIGGKAIVKIDNRVEARKEAAIDMATWASSNGLTIIQGLLRNYAIDNHSGVIESVKQISDVLRNPEESKATVDRFIKVQLDKQLDTLEGRKALLSYIEQKLNVVINIETITTAPITLMEAGPSVTITAPARPQAKGYGMAGVEKGGPV
jgi:hypothetical protein